MSPRSTTRSVHSAMLLALCFVAISLTASAQPRWQWVKTAIGPTFVELTDAAIGPDGDLYMNGTYNDSVTFDGEPVISVGNYDNFTARYSSTGQVRDFDGYGGLDADDSRSMAVDNKGNMYVCGSFFDQAIVGGQIIEAVEAFGGDMYLAKFDKVGIMQWVKVFGSPTYDEIAPYVAVDSLGSVYLAGGFGGEAQFGTKTVTSNGKSDIFVAKISALGDVTWVRSAGAVENDEAKGISVSANGDRIYTVGTFQRLVNFQTNTITSIANSMDFFVWTHNANGEAQWVRQIGYSGADRYIACTSTPDGKLAITGAMSGTTTFHDREIQTNGEFFSDAFVSRIDKTGTIELVEHYGGVYTDVATDIAVDARGAMYISGYFDSTSTYGGSVVESAGDRDAFIARLHNTGKVEWIRSAGGKHRDEGRAVLITPDGVPYLAGIFDTEALFGDILVTDGRFSDAFIAQLECGPNTALSPPGPDITICEGQDSTLTSPAGYPGYQWYVDGEEAASRFKFTLNRLTQGTHQVYVRITDYYGCSLNSDTITVTVTEGLPEPLVTQDGDFLFCSITEGVTYQWYLEGRKIDGATGRSIEVTGDGNYQVKIMNDMGCDRISENFLIGVTSVNDDDSWAAGAGVTVYPNPFSHRITVRCNVGSEIFVTDVTGREVARATATETETLLEVDGATGVYVVAIRTAAGTQTILSLKR